jgi:cytochrome oxidase Cu insertion factor (SCO1/SenC/PrrC family)
VGEHRAKIRGETRRRQRRKRRLLVLAGLGLLAAVIVSYLGWNLGWTAAAEGDPAPPFVLPDQQGRQVSLADYLGRKPVLLVFYMTYG